MFTALSRASSATSSSAPSRERCLTRVRVAPSRPRRTAPNRAEGTFQGMPGPSKDDSPSELETLRREIASLRSELATERTAKTMIESQLRACVNEVSKILAKKRDLEIELADARDEKK